MAQRNSKGVFIDETVKKSFRLSYFTRVNKDTELAYKIKYIDYTKKTTVKMGVRSTLRDSFRVRVLVAVV